MFCNKSEFNTNGQHVIERKAYVVISDGPRFHNVYENDEMEFYVYWGGFIVTVGCHGEVWFSE